MGNDLLAKAGVVGVHEGAAVERCGMDDLVDCKPEGWVDQIGLALPNGAHNAEAHQIPLELGAI
jgi:hypothetical protein